MAFELLVDVTYRYEQDGIGVNYGDPNSIKTGVINATIPKPTASNM